MEKSAVVVKSEEYDMILALFVFRLQRRIGLQLARQVLKLATVGDLHQWLAAEGARA